MAVNIEQQVSPRSLRRLRIVQRDAVAIGDHARQVGQYLLVGVLASATSLSAARSAALRLSRLIVPPRRASTTPRRTAAAERLLPFAPGGHVPAPPSLKRDDGLRSRQDLIVRDCGPGQFVCGFSIRAPGPLPAGSQSGPQ